MMKPSCFLSLLISASFASGASAEEQGQLASRSQGSISIRVSIAPRLHLRSAEPVMTAGSGRRAMMCLDSNLPPAGFTVTASTGAGDITHSGQAPAPGPAQAVPARCLELAFKADRASDGPLLLIVRPE